MGHKSKKPAAVSFLFENSIFLIAGALGALIWANTSPESYEHFVHLDLLGGNHAPADNHAPTDNHAAPVHAEEATHAEEPHVEPAADGEQSSDEATPDEKHDGEHSDSEHKDAETDGHSGKASDDHGGGGHGGFTIHFLINDILMALFFAIAGKEVWEALLPGGPLSNPKKAATPLLATLGGILGPAGIYMAGVLMTGEEGLTNGWAIPCATDIAFSYLVARIIFGAGHPAIAFLLLLAIADDAAGLIILAIFYPSAPLAPEWLLLSAGGIGLGFFFRKLKLQSFWFYLLIPGVMSWISFYKAGIHPALGLVPIIPCMPHALTDLGLFARDELNRDDTLNEFEHWWKDPVEIILGLFGLVNAGVLMTSVGTGTWLVLGGLIIGKPLGITLMTFIAQKVFKLEIPGGMGYRHVVTLGMVAAIGFTVALFVSTAAFPNVGGVQSPYLDSVKMGALGSFGAAFLSIIIAKMLGVKPTGAEDTPDEPAADAAH
jgi:Na+:H+ antiporter, NhaA family